MITLIAAIFLTYLLGAVPVSYIIAKRSKGIDIRERGSGNVGATNVMRTAGKVPGILALFLDILKGVIAVTLVARIFSSGITIDYQLYQILLGISVISGHVWTVFMGFKGGKGVATTAGVLVVLAPKILLIALSVWIITILISKYVSLGSILASMSIPITAALMGRSLHFVIFSITLCIICTYRHKANIVRLINGEESRIGRRVNT
ncbi:MAG: glycerol-3-phosphate 1-O-acyltransferase PlsY [Candidatus Omnitrophica bacterium]|nr:glycerol-3-phosphate 1-O-acyltransferase PlsY [Candidatus Omnitrophota bacterium]